MGPRSAAPRPKVVYSPSYEVDIGAHVFPTAKYRLVRDRIIEAGIVDEGDFVEPTPATAEQLGLVHTAEYLDKIERDSFTALERWTLEVPFSREMRDASVLCCGGTTLTGREALADGVAVHLGGGFHHAFADHGEGFCLLNDIAVAAATLVDDGSADRVMVVDLDVHHGNGTAAIFSDEPRVFTLSMHQQENYPAIKPPSDLDVGLPNGIRDEQYLELLDESLSSALSDHEPDLVLYLAGADPYREDQLGGLGLSLEGLASRDAMVLEASRERDAAVAVTLAGGYAFQQEDTVAIHAATVAEAVRVVGRAR